MHFGKIEKTLFSWIALPLLAGALFGMLDHFRTIPKKTDNTQGRLAATESQKPQRLEKGQNSSPIFWENEEDSAGISEIHEEIKDEMLLLRGKSSHISDPLQGIKYLETENTGTQGQGQVDGPISKLHHDNHHYSNHHHSKHNGKHHSNHRISRKTR